MKIINYEQRSELWAKIRRGRPTASQFHRIVLGSGKPSGQGRAYFSELLWERLTGQDTTRDLSHIAAVQWGIEHEEEACAQFELIEGRKLERIGFCMTDDGRLGCSPDRIIQGLNQAVEVKCPLGPTHINNMLGDVPVAGTDPMEKYFAQVMGQIWICGFDCVHLFSYHPYAPPFLKTFGPDRAFLGKMVPLLSQFCDALDECERTLRSLGEFRLEGDPLPGFPAEDESDS
jgi:hypothetical protein